MRSHAARENHEAAAPGGAAASRCRQVGEPPGGAVYLTNTIAFDSTMPSLVRRQK